MTFTIRHSRDFLNILKPNNEEEIFKLLEFFEIVDRTREMRCRNGHPTFFKKANKRGKDGYSFRCRTAGCQSWVSIRTGTIFEIVKIVKYQ
jgi:hypothetical protein